MQLPLVSIVICAKNEAEPLRQNLPEVLRQAYPQGRWEVVVVDDASTDATASVLKDFQERFPQLKVVTLPQGLHRVFPGKKEALHRGISVAAFDKLLLTDADCRPLSDQWLLSFARTSVGLQQPVVLGYGGYEKHPGLLNKMIQWETLETCMQYAGMALAGRPYMGVGRNLMYEKSLYEAALQEEPFQTLYASLPSGDDDLLIGRMATAQNTGLCLSRGAQTVSTPPNSFREWLHQKQRHVSTGKYYPPRVKFLLGIAALSRGLFWLLWPVITVLFLIALTRPFGVWELAVWGGGVLLGLLRMFLYKQYAGIWRRTLKIPGSNSFYLRGELCLSFVQLMISPYIFWKNKQQWK